MKQILRAAAWLSLIFCAACATEVKNYPTLVNAGILSLSTTDPYLGANLFLSQELERSTNLFNFFKTRGAPAAIEIVEKGFKPTHIILYYPGQRQAYAADLFKSSARREWIIRGPFAIERQDFRAITRLEAAMTGEPVFLMWGKDYRFRFHQKPTQAARVLRPEVALIPTPQPAPPRKPPAKVLKPDAASAGPQPTPTIPADAPLTFDQQALLAAKQFAETAPSGDLIHTVKGPAQDLEKIVEWYTGSAAHAPEVAEANNLDVEIRNLSGGTRLRIPARLIKERRRMPDE